MTDHQVQINARQLAEMEEAGVADVISKARCTCQHDKGGPILAKFYSAPDDAGTRRLWAWTPAWKGAGKAKVLPHAVPVPIREGDAAWTQVAQCPRCRATWLVFPGGIPDGVRPGVPIAFTGNRSATSEWSAGDSTNVATVTEDAIRGPGPVALVRLNPPTWGAVAAGDTPEEDSADR